MKCPNDPDYNHSTLYIPPEDFNSLTDGMKRYWEIKKFNMDKILLYRFGDWYVVYFEDLTICSKIMELNVTPHPGQAQLGFEIVFLEENIGKLTERGYKVAVCEQIENRNMMDNRLKAQMEVKKEKKRAEKESKKINIKIMDQNDKKNEVS